MAGNAKNKSSSIILVVTALVIFGVLGYGITQNYSKNKTGTQDEIYTTQNTTVQMQTTVESTTAVPTKPEPSTAKPTTVPHTTAEPTTEPPTTKAGIDKMDVYKAYLDIIKSSEIEGYYIYDVNHDGIPELILSFGQFDFDHHFDFYTYNSENGLIYTYSIEGNRVLYESYEGTLKTFWAKQGCYRITEVEMNNASIIENTLVDEYTSGAYPEIDGVKLTESSPDDIGLLVTEFN